jgi:phosphoglycolate phosphatase-like HAD superfamily hydrolase
MSVSFHLLIAVIVGLVSSAVASSQPSSTLILLDIDNTLYSESDSGIEAQIVKNTHYFCRERYGMDKETADDMFRRFGSTVEGLKKTRWKDASDEELQKKLDEFYNGVYKDIDYSGLLLKSKLLTESSTGYSHAKDRELLCRLLQFSHHPLCVASNSPSWHVQKTLEAMGLGNIQFRYRFTPDRLPFYPTKNDPKEYFAGAGDDLNAYDRLILFDDSRHNLQRICDYFPNAEGVHVSDENTLADSILRNGLLDPKFSFNQVAYLESKNIVDRASMDSELWNGVVEELLQLREGEIQIVDVGAGILSMLDLFLHGDSKVGLNRLLDKSNQSVKINYIAYESNRALYNSCHYKLLSWGFSMKEQVSEEEFVYEADSVRLRFILKDFDSGGTNHPPDLIVGCCFADLMDPRQLVASLIRSFHLLESKNTMVYFPITFGGITQFLPPRPFETNGEHKIPSDTVAFGLYSKALVETLGHNLDLRLLQDVMEDYGAYLERKGASNWKIDQETHSYLYETMLYFFGTAGGPKILQEGWDANSWIQRARQNRPNIQVSNVDLLFRIGQRSSNTCHSKDSSRFLNEIQFTAPREVTTTKKEIPDLGPNQVLSKCA